MSYIFFPSSPYSFLLLVEIWRNVEEMKNIFHSKYGILWIVILLLAVNYVFSIFHYRLDLTGEKRFTISNPTKNLLAGLQDKVEIKILLDGEMPSGFRKLANSSKDMLSEFKEYAGLNLSYAFERPDRNIADSMKTYLYDSLKYLGINATNVKAQTKEGEGEEQRIVFPGAIITYKGRTIGIDFLQGQNFQDGITSLNNADALLEYKFASAIRKITLDSIPLVGYLIGNGEPLDYRVKDLIDNTLRMNYAFRIIPIDSVDVLPEIFKVIMVVKPMEKFTDDQKLKLDQYVMHGGKTVWMLDNLYASLDSLQRSEGQFIAFDLGLNIEDLLFKYGVRINRDLVQDLQSDKIPSVIGSVGDKPQIQLLPWPYFPLLRNNNGHPIGKNLDYIKSEFPQSLDTIETSGIRKTILLNTSTESRSLSTPAKVEWASIKNEEDLKSFNKSNIPVAVLLEGRFHSLYANRLNKEISDKLSNSGSPFRDSNDRENSMVVVSDGDIALNSVTQQDGPLAMGMNPYTKQQYANKEFLLNVMEYLTDDSGILEARAKDYSLRLIDKSAYEGKKLYWQIANILLPILLMMLFVYFFQFIRKRKFGYNV
ncbi:MAG: gliding motility-associated ABC transporter substrate-binding protein GldG [Chitinophagaceae bacterium]